MTMLAHSSVRQKLNRVSSVHFSYVVPYAPLNHTYTGTVLTILTAVVRHRTSDGVVCAI